MLVVNSAKKEEDQISEENAIVLTIMKTVIRDKLRLLDIDVDDT